VRWSRKITYRYGIREGYEAKRAEQLEPFDDVFGAVKFFCEAVNLPITAAAISSLTCWDAVGVMSNMDAAAC